MTKLVNVSLDYTPRWYQQRFESAMFSGCKRAILVWHRRCGKDIACLNFMINEMIKKVGVYYYIFPSQRQARKVIWDGIDESGKAFLSFFPKELIEGKPNNTEMKVKFKNGSLFQLVGSDHYDSLAGTNPCGVVLSEYSLQDPKGWELILSPILLKNGGWAVFNGTPRGKNHQYELHTMANRNEDWFVQKLTIDDTNLISQQQLDKERKEGRSEEILQQEYYCSYDRGIEGTFYGKLIDEAHRSGRIGNVPYDPAVAIDTYWDLGFGDSTAIVFTQSVGQELHVIDYYENHGEGLTHYAKMLQDKNYVYGTHFGPHDIEAGHLSIGKSLKSYAQELGLRFQVIPKTEVEYGIECVRSQLAITWFDEKKCSHLIKCLENYHKKFNDKMNCYSTTPVHDWSSHGADSFRYCCIGRKILGKPTGGLTKEKIKEMRNKYVGY